MLNYTIEMQTTDGKKYNLIPVENYKGGAASVYQECFPSLGGYHDHCINGWWQGEQMVVEYIGSLDCIPENGEHLELLLVYEDLQ